MDCTHAEPRFTVPPVTRNRAPIPSSPVESASAALVGAPDALTV
jgi:hypothetical protein